MEEKTKPDDTKSVKSTRRKYVSCLCLISTLVGISAAVIGISVRLGLWPLSDEDYHEVSLQAQILFKQLDRNGDGYLTLQEFEPISSRINEENVCILQV